MESKYDVEKLKQYEVEILDKFVSWCKENNLNYYLAYGTLLGAVRHKGFIPWDDDIDVYMKGEDYYKFKEIMLKNNDQKYFYQSLESEKYYNLPFAKIRMNNTLAVEKKHQNEKMHQGIYIDIFPLIPFPNNTNDQKKIAVRLKKFNLLVQADMHDRTAYNSYGKTGKIISRILKFIPRSIRNNMAIKILKRIILYSGEYDNYICIIDNKKFSKTLFDNMTDVTFESRKYHSPKNYDGYLTQMYGKYMELPKEEDRITHNFIKVKFDD